MSHAPPLELDSPPPQADRLKTDTLAASMAMLLGVTVLQRMIGFLRGVLFCRWLDAEQLGQWDLAWGFLMLAAPLAVLGLPGSFGRYVEYYRQRSQLRPFLLRSGAWLVLLGALGVGCMLSARPWFAELIFGSAQYADLTWLVALALGVVVIDNAFTSLYTALRQIKFVSAMQFTSSLVFAVLGVTLLLGWQRQPVSVVAAFTAACLVTSSLSTWWLWRLWPSLPPAAPGLTSRSMWAKLLPFALSLWATNWLTNVLGIVDRWMIIHYSGLPAAEALNLVGQYHTARIFPVLFIGVAELLGATVTPHLSADWEAGRRRRVSYRLNLVLKAFGLGLVAASIVVLWIAPVLFNQVWQHRYADGLSVLPLALMCAVWIGLANVSNNYLWCAEKSRYVCVALAVGLGLNIACNLVLLPALGLRGAVLSTAISRLVALALLWWMGSRFGMRIDRGLILVAGLTASLALGPWVALALLAVVLLDVVPGLSCFSAREKADLWAKLQRVLGR